MPPRLLCLAAASAAVAACSVPPAPPGNQASNETAAVSDSAAQSVRPPAPGTRGGLPGDRRPVSEAPFAATSAQAAANLVQTYYALLEAGRHGDARRLWSGGGEASEAEFAGGFAAYSGYHAQVGAPGPIEGAAGSLYVGVPVVIYGRRKDGAAFSRKATVTLRRVNDIPGSPAEDRKWHIRSIEEQSGP